MLDLRADFPILEQEVGPGIPLVYLDSGATSQMPRQVMDVEARFRETANAAVHRGSHRLAVRATDAFESARERMARFIGADPDEIVWTSGATAGLNLLAHALTASLQAGDEILVTEAEHHANLVPWQQLAARTGATLRWVELADDGTLRTEQLDALVTERTRVVAFTHISNVTGIVTDVAAFVTAAQRIGAITVLDMSQSVPHRPVDVRLLDVDFGVFSGHKMHGPTGVGVLYGRRERLAALAPVNTGGSMVELVTMTEATFVAPPQRFEAGTQMVSQAVALAAAADYLTTIDPDALQQHEAELATLLEELESVPGIRRLGDARGVDRLALASFVVDGVHAHDAGQFLDEQGIAVRVGHHCAQPLHRRYGVAASIRASASVFTTPDEIRALITAVAGVQEFFGVSAR